MGEGATAIHMAAHRGHTGIVEMLLEHGAEPNLGRVEGPYHGLTPLHDAARSGQLEVAELLLAAGAEVNAEAERDLSDVVPPDMQHLVEGDERFTPLYFVRYVRDDDVADALEELLIDHGGTT